MQTQRNCAVRSVLGGEIYAFADALNYAYCMKFDVEKIVDQKIGIRMFTDSKSLFDKITKSSDTTEKRLMIDIKAKGEEYDLFQISDIGFIRSHNHPVDIFMKMAELTLLPHIVQIRKTYMKMEQ